jgi:hypothetical protein
MLSVRGYLMGDHVIQTYNNPHTLNLHYFNQRFVIFLQEKQYLYFCPLLNCVFDITFIWLFLFFPAQFSNIKVNFTGRTFRSYLKLSLFVHILGHWNLVMTIHMNCCLIYLFLSATS